MSKLITSPVKRFPGTVLLSDPLTVPQAMAFQDGIDAIQALGDKPGVLKVNQAILPGVIACVEEWHLEGMGAKFDQNPSPLTFPASPSIASATLVSWLINEITNLFRDAIDIPNE